MQHRSLKQIAKWLGCLADSQQIQWFEQDSRAVVPGTLFFALKGAQVDGHDFLQEAATRGALAAVVSKNYVGPSYGMQLFQVDDVLIALQQLARLIMAQRSSKIIAVTGSVGKTTTKEFIATLLQKKFRTQKTPGNANSQIGLPLALLNGHSDEEIFVIEMGMTQRGEIARLVSIVAPDIALITRIAPAHIRFFADGLDGIAAAKAEIFSSPHTSLGILSAQAAQFPAIQRAMHLPKITYSTAEAADLTLEHHTQHHTQGYRIVEKGVASPYFSLPFSESHLCEDFLGAVSVCRALKMSWDEILAQVPLLTSAKSRFERIEKDGILYINDTYNANEVSVRAALSNLPQPQPGKKRIAVLAKMADLGELTEQTHRAVAHFALQQIDHLLCFGAETEPMVDVFKAEKRPAEHFSDLQHLKQRLAAIAESGDVVLVKGANSTKMWRVLE